MASAPKMNSVKGVGKQKASEQTAKSEVGASDPSLFQQAMWAARELWMGPLDGEPGKIGELENETWDCECSTREAICGAEPTKKLSALRHGLDELQKRLCASATRYYNKCFRLALRNRTELDATFSVVAAELGRTSHISNPAEFARAFTIGDLSTFLGVTEFDGKEKAQEIGFDGRVREFIRHVCGDYSHVLVADPDAEKNKTFLLPRWPTGRTVGARMAQWWRPPANGDESSPVSIEETEWFILGAEEMLIKNLRRAIAHAHRLALVDLANVVIITPSPSDMGVIAANVSQKASTKPINSRRSDKRSFRLGVMFEAIKSGKRGLDYCNFLSENGLTTPESWRGDSCPESYPLAYQRGGRPGNLYRKFIRSEKCRSGRLRSRLELEDPAELRRILSIANRTPRH